MFRITAVFITLWSASIGLVCFETLENGSVFEKNCSQCRYCHISGPSLGTKPTASGLYDEVEVEEERIYDQAFELGGKAGPVDYSVLATCMLERYDSPLMKNPEYLYRCVCNKNKCNNGQNFEKFLNNLKYE